MKQIGKKVVILMSLFLVFLGLTAQGKEIQDIEYLIKAFEQTDAELEGYWVQFGFPYETIKDETELLTLGNTWSESLDLPINNQLQVGTDNLQPFYYTEGKWGERTKIEFVIKHQDENSRQLYILFNLHGESNLEELKKHYAKLENILNDYQISPIINSCIQGNINDKLNNISQSVLTEGILHNLDATTVEELDTDLVKSVSAYSPLLKNFIWTGSNKMNIQVATHYNSLDKKTTLTVGTPIIKIEY